MLHTLQISQCARVPQMACVFDPGLTLVSGDVRVGKTM